MSRTSLAPFYSVGDVRELRRPHKADDRTQFMPGARLTVVGRDMVGASYEYQLETDDGHVFTMTQRQVKTQTRPKNAQ